MKLNKLIDEKKLDNRIEELAYEIDKYYNGENIVAICVLNGAAFFATNLALKMKTKMKLEFLKISSYQGKESTGIIKKYLDIDDEKVKNQNILIIEDIVDTGRSMSYLLEHLLKKNPKDIKVCSLLSKPSRREVDVKIDFLGFEVPDRFIIGYGFDDEEGFFRNIPYIGYR